MASDNESAMPTGIANDLKSPMPDSSEDDNPPISENQIDGTADNPTTRFSKDPASLEVAKTQGIALLRAVLSDPHGAIANEIVKTKGFKGQHASNDRCKTVRNLFTGQREVEDDSVDFVLATWCMLGGGIPAIWVVPREKNRGGEKKALTEWGEEMLEDLQHLIMGNNSGFKHCKAYAKGIVAPASYNWAEAENELEAAEKVVAESPKKPNAKAGSSSAGAAKRPPSSPQPSSQAKRQRTSEKNKEVPSSNKGDEPASEPKDDIDSGTDDDSVIADITTGRRGEILLPAPKSGGLEEMRRRLKESCKEQYHWTGNQVKLWNDLVLAAHVNIDNHPDRAADMHTMLVECSGWLPKSEAKGKGKGREIDDKAWRDFYSAGFEDATEKTTIGQCPFCPVQYRFSEDPSLLHGEAHDPQRLQDHQVNLCHDTMEDLKIRKRIAAERLGVKVVMWKGKRRLDIDPLNDVYTKKLLKSARKLTRDMEKWNNRLHQLDLMHKIVETADAGNIDKLRSEMLALRVCLQSNIVPPLVTEPTYILEMVRHEVNTLTLPEVEPDGFAPSTAKYNCPPGLEDGKHERYDLSTYNRIQSTVANASAGDSNLQEQLTKLQQQLVEKDQVIEKLKARDHGPSETKKHLLDALKAQTQGGHDLTYHMSKALDLMFEENQRLMSNLAIAIKEKQEAEAVIKEANEKHDKIQGLERQVELYKSDKNSLREELDTSNHELTAAESRIDELKSKVSDLKSENRVLLKGLDKGWPTVVSSLKVAQTHLSLERRWLESTTFSQLGAYALQFEHGLDTPLSDIKNDLIGTHSFPKTPAITEPANESAFSSSRESSRPDSGVSGKENRESNGGPSGENREDSH